jgi:hypothetical protein
MTVGAGAGVYATRRVTRLVHNWTPESVAARAGGRLRVFAQDVRTEMRAREAQLREAVEIDRTPQQLEQPRPRRILKAPYTIIDDDKDGH